MAIHKYEKDGHQFYEVYLNVISLSGKRVQMRRKGISTFRQAQNVEFDLKRELADEKVNRKYSWKEWHEVCVDRMRLEMRPSTIQNYDLTIKKVVHPLWKSRDLRSINSTDVYDLIYNQLGNASANTRKHLLKMVRRIFNMAIEEGLLDRNPAVKIKVRVPELKQSILNVAEANRLLREAKVRGHKFYEIWAFALFTGMRSSELYALKWSDVDFENKRIYVNQNWCRSGGYGPTKSRRNRTVPISSELLSLLKEMQLKSEREAEFVLPKVQEWTNGEQAKITRSFCKLTGITPVKFHDLRATFITQLLLRNVPLAKVMSMVGHSDLKTTNVYLRIIGGDLDGATDKLSYCLPAYDLGKVISLNELRK